MANSTGKTNRLHPQRGREGSISNENSSHRRVVAVHTACGAPAGREAQRRQMPIDNASRLALGQSKTHPSTTLPAPMSGSFNARGIIFCGRTVGVKRRAASPLGPFSTRRYGRRCSLQTRRRPGLHTATRTPAHPQALSLAPILHVLQVTYRTVQYRHEGLSSNRHAQPRSRMRRASG